jgi:hypothetical protein
VRSAAEIRFRLRQEWNNLWLYVRPPRLTLDAPTPLPGLPDPETVARSVRSQPLAAALRALAESILEHRIPLLGYGDYPCGDPICWRRDAVNGRESSLVYFRRVPYLDAGRVGDHKLIWELNRHQHLVALAQAWRLERDARYPAEIIRQLRHWESENPFLRGINWTSALEVAFRALSWIWIYHLAGEAFDAEFRRWMIARIARHGYYLAANLSVYFSPNTHLLGEAVALHAIGTLLPALPDAARWREAGAHWTNDAMHRQVREDGGYFEQSTYYHVYALDFFLLHAVLNPAVSSAYRGRLACMAEWLDAVLPPSGRLPLLGDDDGGRVFHPYGERARFAEATLATAAVYLNRPEWLRSAAALSEQALWWLGPQACAQALSSGHRPRSSRWFPASGLAVLVSDEAHVIVDAGPFGDGSAGHSHADTLSLVASLDEEELLIDPGAFTYVADAAWRDRFRGVAAHNTVQFGTVEQANLAGPFRWRHPPRVQVHGWSSGGREDRLEASCQYAGFTHRRLCVFRKPAWLLIADWMDGPGEPVPLTLRWHAGVAVAAETPRRFLLGARARLILSHDAAVEPGWRSRAFGVKEAAPVVTVRAHTRLPHLFATVLAFADPPAKVCCQGGVVEVDGWRVAVGER